MADTAERLKHHFYRTMTPQTARQPLQFQQRFPGVPQLQPEFGAFDPNRRLESQGPLIPGMRHGSKLSSSPIVFEWGLNLLVDQEET